MPRADATRNRRSLLDAASAELAAHGLDVSIARIASRAGVAKGTVFNHFPTKEDLVAEIFADRVAGLVAVGEGLRDADDPEAALLRFMTAGIELQANDRSFCQAAASIPRADPRVRAASERLARIAEDLTRRARDSGAIRTDVTGHDIVLLFNAASQAAAPLGDTTPGLWRRYLHLIFDALRPASARELPVAAPTAEHFTAAARRTPGHLPRRAGPRPVGRRHRPAVRDRAAGTRPAATARGRPSTVSGGAGRRGSGRRAAASRRCRYGSSRTAPRRSCTRRRR
jgi:AcrR family transcriptional regulator